MYCITVDKIILLEISMLKDSIYAWKKCFCFSFIRMKWEKLNIDDPVILQCVSVCFVCSPLHCLFQVYNIPLCGGKIHCFVLFFSFWFDCRREFILITSFRIIIICVKT